jgi:hypothetical protein
VCDGADTCDGAGNCQDNLEPDTTVCRDLAGPCDTVEFCDGAGGCDADAIKSAGELCEGAADGIFCTEDRCDGAGALASNCKSRKQNSLCDDGDTCTKDRCAPTHSGADPATGCSHESREGKSCDDQNSCTRSDVCFREGDGAGDVVCGGSPRRAGRDCNDGACAGGAGECNADGECIADADAPPEGTPCSDGNSCTISDACTAAGECAGHALDKGALCSDGEVCTAQDLCIPTLDGSVCHGVGAPMNGEECPGGQCFAGECVDED